MAEVLLRFTRVLKNDTVLYLFEGFGNIDSRWELPCEYLSGPHFAAWNGILLYSDGRNLFSLSPGSELSENVYLEFMSIIETGKQRLKNIRNRNCS